MRIPSVDVKPEYTRFKGGLDLQSPALQIDPGALIAVLNYMCDTDGGYSRIDGYERYDGRTSPSDGTYYRATCTFSNGGPAVGDTITGADSTETAVVVVVGATYICYTKRSGAFNADEVFTVAAVAKGTFTAIGVEKGETSPLLHATALNAAADVYRSDIAKPAGTSGPCRGLGILAGVLYGFWDNTGATAGLIFKATSSGWTAVDISDHEEIYFDTGVGTIAVGDTITGAISGATATVEAVVVTSGAWEANAAGKLVVSGVAGGPFQIENLTVTGVEATVTVINAAISITVGGRYEIVPYNFTGSTDTEKLYGCDGVNRAFEFDGSVYVPIDTGMTTDTPKHIRAYLKQLFLSFRGSNQNSAPGEPHVWSVVTGAGEIAIGDTIVGYARQAKALAIMSRNSTNQLLGSTVADWDLDDISDETGAIEWTIQNITRTFYLDDRGIISLSRAQEYGNFNIATLSRKIQARIDAMRQVVVASSVYRSKDQYRLYGNDGTGVCMTLGTGRYGPEYYFSLFEYPDNVACAVDGEDSTGKDVVFFGDDAGMVYQADKGSSFDGENIEAYAFLPFNNSKSPSVLKTYRRAIIEMTAIGYSAISYNALFSYGSVDIQAHRSESAIVAKGGLWDLSTFGEFFYDQEVVGNPAITLEGDGENCSLFVYSDTDLDLGHKIDGAIVHYTPRR